jgi:hypothetical protein
MLPARALDLRHPTLARACSGALQHVGRVAVSFREWPAEPCIIRGSFFSAARRRGHASMTARVLDGKRIADELIEHIRLKVRDRVRAAQCPPGLAVILVGADPASQVVRAQQAPRLRARRLPDPRPRPAGHHHAGRIARR